MADNDDIIPDRADGAIAFPTELSWDQIKESVNNSRRSRLLAAFTDGTITYDGTDTVTWSSAIYIIFLSPITDTVYTNTITAGNIATSGDNHILYCRLVNSNSTVSMVSVAKADFRRGATAPGLNNQSGDVFVVGITGTVNFDFFRSGLNVNSHVNLLNKNGESNVQHLTSAQVTALHAIYVHPTTSGNKHIPSGGATDNVLVWDSDGVAVWGTASGGGDALWNSDNTPAVTRYYNIPAIMFALAKKTDDFSTWSWKFDSTKVAAITSAVSTYNIPVNLPHGATVTKVSGYIGHASGASMSISLRRLLNSSGAINSLGALLSGIQTNVALVTNSSISNADIDNSLYFYIVQIITTGGVEHRIRNFLIDYTVVRPQP